MKPANRLSASNPCARRALLLRLSACISLATILFAGCSTAPQPSVAAAHLTSASARLAEANDPVTQTEAIRKQRRALAASLRALEHPEADRFFTVDIPPGDTLRPVRPTRTPIAGLQEDGVGLPLVIHRRDNSPNAPKAGFFLPATLIAEDTSKLPVALRTVYPYELPPPRTDAAPAELVAYDLEAPFQQLRRHGPGMLAGFGYLLRTDRFERPRITFLEPYRPGKTPLVLVHGLLSTPQAWVATGHALLADPEIRKRYQIWTFYYPTGQPIPLSAAQLREALDDARRTHGVREPFVLVGHSMGGILSRAQVSGISLETASKILPNLATLPSDHLLRRTLVFEPRTDVKRVVFMATPHQGSHMATSGIAGAAIRMIRLPGQLETQIGSVLASAFDDTKRIPTSIQGLSPNSSFLQKLHQSRPAVPVHSIIGDRGRPGILLESSDGVVPYTSAHLPFAESEKVIPANHGVLNHPEGIAELIRILKLP